MAYPNLGAHLPVVRYSRGACFPGASHAVVPGGKQLRSRQAVPFSPALLLLVPLMLLAILFRPGRLLTTQKTSPPAPTTLRARTAFHPPVHGDLRLSAAPRKGQFVRFFRMRATAYTPINTRMEGGRYTSTLRDGRSVHGVAVDPDLIPLGSRLWIPGYGHAVADDIGGAIHGHHVDLRMQKSGHMDRWGVKPVRVYVLEEPPASSIH